MTYAPRAITAPELALLRSDDQSSQLYLAIHKPAVVYTALVNQTFPSKDVIAQVVYDAGVGTLADVLPGMTLYIGSSAGASDLGLCRIRKAPSGTIFYVGENSDVLWADDVFLTVVDDFGIWAKHLTTAANVPYMDYDIPYSDQHTNTSPIPILGPRYVPVWLAPATLNNKIDQTDGAISYVGTWGLDVQASHYLGSAAYSNSTGDYAEFTFTGNKIELIAPKANNQGIVKIYVDAVLDATIDLYNVSTLFQQVFYTKVLSQGVHTIKMEVTGTKNPSSSDYYFELDAIYYEYLQDLAVVPFDASLSYCLPDTSIASYAWMAPGASTTSGLATATPSITYNATGSYRIECVLTAANGKTTTAFVYVEVFHPITRPPISQFDLKSCNGSASDSGWKFSISMWSQADLPNVVDRAMVVLFARDFYGTTEISIGQIAARENIIAIGWIGKESITEDPDGSSVEFTVETAQSWMKKIAGFPIGIQNYTIASDAWTNWYSLTVDKSLYHLFYWQSTVIPVVDVFLTGDTKLSAEQYAAGDTSVYDQITPLLKNTLLGSCGCDRFNRLFCEVDTQLTPVTARSAFPTIMTLEKIDWRDQLPITRTATNITSQVNLSGVAINLPSPATPIFSLAPGHVYTPWGRPTKQDRMLLSTQALANELAALKLAWDNHTFDFSPDLSANNRMLDIFPSHQYVAISVADTDTPRDFAYTGNLLVREISISFESSGQDPSNFLQISWQCEQEVFPGNSTDGDLPAKSDVPVSDVPPVSFSPAPVAPYIAVEPVQPSSLKNVVILAAGQGVFYTSNFDAPAPGMVHWLKMGSGTSYLGNFDSTGIVNLEVNSAGMCFCQERNNIIWYAPYPGATWKVLFDINAIGNPEGFPFPREQKITGFAVNRDDDSIIILAGVNVTVFGTFLQYIWKGSSSGVTLVTPNTINTGSSLYFQYGFGTYGDGVWTMTYEDANNINCKFFTLDSSGVTPGPTITLPAYIVSCRGRYANQTVLGTDGTLLYISQDNGITLPLDVGAPPPYSFYYNIPVDTSADGQKILLGTQLLGMKKSSDGGATWSPTSTLAAVTAVTNLGTDLDWLFAFIGQICYTPDMGTTFVYRTGDLQSWAGALCQITHIRWFQ